MKAYYVSEECEGSAVVRFANHAVVARREGANELNDEFEYVSCRRAPEFDQYAPGPIPAQVLLDHGWFFYCGGCGKQIYQDTEPRIIVVKNDAYCSPWCRLRLVERRGRDRADRNLAEHLAKQKFPGVIEPYGFRTSDRKNVRKQVLQARFRFPGSKYPATWQVGATPCWIHPDDSDAFDSWKASGYA